MKHYHLNAGGKMLHKTVRSLLLTYFPWPLVEPRHLSLFFRSFIFPILILYHCVLLCCFLSCSFTSIFDCKALQLALSSSKRWHFMPRDPHNLKTNKAILSLKVLFFKMKLDWTRQSYLHRQIPSVGPTYKLYTWINVTHCIFKLGTLSSIHFLLRFLDSVN